MKSLCIKTNNLNILDYLLGQFSSFPLEDVYFSQHKFSIYSNIIIHYRGLNESLFYYNLSNILTQCIIKFYETNWIKQLIRLNYFYFNSIEQQKIADFCYELLNTLEDSEYSNRAELIYVSVLDFIKENHSILLDGFVNFRLYDYRNCLDGAVDLSVNKFIIEKEYLEFINLLQVYIRSKEPQTDLVHLIYMNEESILLDSSKNIISVSDSTFNAKYLSDISFSSNDYSLNSLLTILPKKIELHLIDIEDEFIHTLKLIFGKRISICTDCNICKTYKLIQSSTPVNPIYPK